MTVSRLFRPLSIAMSVACLGLACDQLGSSNSDEPLVLTLVNWLRGVNDRCMALAEVEVENATLQVVGASAIFEMDVTTSQDIDFEFVTTDFELELELVFDDSIVVVSTDPVTGATVKQGGGDAFAEWTSPSIFRMEVSGLPDDNLYSAQVDIKTRDANPTSCLSSSSEDEGGTGDSETGDSEGSGGSDDPTGGDPTTLVNFCDVYSEADFGALIGADVMMTPGASGSDTSQRCDIVSPDGSVNFTIIVQANLFDDWATQFDNWKARVGDAQVVRPLDWAADGELRRTTEEFQELPEEPPRIDTTVDLMVLAVEPDLFFTVDAATGDNPSSTQTALDPDGLEAAMETAAQAYAQALIEAN